MVLQLPGPPVQGHRPGEALRAPAGERREPGADPAGVRDVTGLQAGPPGHLRGVDVAQRRQRLVLAGAWVERPAVDPGGLADRGRLAETGQAEPAVREPV